MFQAIQIRLMLPIVMLILLCGFPPLASAESVTIWIGTGKSARSEGIYQCRLDTATGRLSEPELAATIQGPGFLTRNAMATHLYCVGSLDGEACVAAYRINHDQKSVALDFLNSTASGDGGAAHLALDHTGRMLVSAQYGGGSVAVYAIEKDGRLGARTQLIEHSGGSRAFGTRQNAPCLLYTSPSPRDQRGSRMPSSA